MSLVPLWTDLCGSGARRSTWTPSRAPGRRALEREGLPLFQASSVLGSRPSWYFSGPGMSAGSPDHFSNSFTPTIRECSSLAGVPVFGRMSG